MRPLTKLPLFITLLMAVVFISGCRLAPIYNVDAAPVPANGSVTLSQVSQAIRSAGAGLGWVTKETGDGEIEATLRLRTHKAVVNITFDLNDYSIEYVDSVDLDYDGTNIHSNYNGWIQNLEGAIAAQISAL